jgi:general secretion pathway protein L
VLNSLLEDRLLDEPERLHIALGGQASAEGETWVAVCDRAWLREHVQALEAAGRAPDRIVPEAAPLDETTGTRPTVQLLGEADHPRLRVCRSAGVIELPFSREAWALALGSDAADDTPDVQAEPAVAALAEQMLQRRVRLQPRGARWAQAAGSPSNLAQGEFAQHGGRGALRRMAVAAREFLQSPLWRPLRWGVVALLLVQVAGLNLWAWRERADWRARQAEIDRVLTRSFPGVRVVVDAPAQMARELAQLRQATGASGREDLEPMLAALAVSLEPGAALTALDYQPGTLRVSGPATDDAALARLQAPLRERGYRASRDEGRLRVQALSDSTP